MIESLGLVDARSHPSSSMRQAVAINNIKKLLVAIGTRVDEGNSENRLPITQADAELFETVEDLLRAAYKKALEL